MIAAPMPLIVASMNEAMLCKFVFIRVHSCSFVLKEQKGTP
jgi:hypothetical protein